MSSKITRKEYPLSKVFGADFEYHIPGYQRPYAWTEEEMCDIMTPTNRNLEGIKMAVSNIKAIFENDIHKVWDIIFAVDKYNSWRSDLSKIEIINEKQFIEYTKDGYATTFSISFIYIPAS